LPPSVRWERLCSLVHRTASFSHGPRPRRFGDIPQQPWGHVGSRPFQARSTFLSTHPQSGTDRFPPVDGVFSWAPSRQDIPRGFLFFQSYRMAFDFQRTSLDGVYSFSTTFSNSSWAGCYTARVARAPDGGFPFLTFFSCRRRSLELFRPSIKFSVFFSLFPHFFFFRALVFLFQSSFEIAFSFSVQAPSPPY